LRVAPILRKFGESVPYWLGTFRQEGFDVERVVAALKKAKARGKLSAGYALTTLRNWQAGEPFDPGQGAFLDDELEPIAAAAAQGSPPASGPEAFEAARRRAGNAARSEAIERRILTSRELAARRDNYDRLVVEHWEDLPPGDPERDRCRALARQSFPSGRPAFVEDLARKIHAEQVHGLVDPETSDGGGA